MKIAIFGLSVTSAWGNGHATLWRGLLRSLARAGHDVVFFERDTPFYAQHRDMHRADGYAVVVYPTWDDVLPRARRAAEDADAVIVTSYQADARQACALALESHGKRVYYDLDTPVTLDALDRGHDVPYLPTNGLGDFDLVLSYTGGRALADLRRRLGAKRTAPLYGSVDTATHHPPASSGDARYACDLSYLGTYAADRQRGVEQLLFEPARRLPRCDFVLGGPMYPTGMAKPANVAWLPHVPPAEHPAFYGSSRATLNVTRAAMAKMGYCPSGRLFEAAACGVAIVSDEWEGLDQFFEPGREIVLARDASDVAAALTSADLVHIARNARTRTLAEHTAERRAQELVTLLQQ